MLVELLDKRMNEQMDTWMDAQKDIGGRMIKKNPKLSEAIYFSFNAKYWQGLEKL